MPINISETILYKPTIAFAIAKNLSKTHLHKKSYLYFLQCLVFNDYCENSQCLFMNEYNEAFALI